MGDRPNRYFPAFLDLGERLVLVVGDGEAIARKAERMTTYGADVVVITANATPRLIELEGDGKLTLEQRAYEPGDLKGAFLVVAAGLEPEVRDALVAEADAEGVLFSITGGPARSSYITPSTLTRGGLQIAVSTAGIAPSLARSIKSDLAAQYGPAWGAFVDLLAEVKLATAERPQAERSAIVAWVVESDASQRFLADEEMSADSLVAEYDQAHPEEPIADDDEAPQAEAPDSDPGTVENQPDAEAK